MNRFFRHNNPGMSDYAGLALFAVVYLAALTFVISPGTFISRDTTQSGSYSTD